MELESISLSIWFLIGAALVFFMQSGFAMVECGFTRAKNAGNIIMKNLMDFCIGTVVFVLLGYGLLAGPHVAGGFIGTPTLSMFGSGFASFDWSNFVFQLVFCATCATIVSGAMAERTKFSAYCLYSAVISLVIYPIEAGWAWGEGGWLSELGFIDFAGSCVIHMAGGITALIGAIFLGPRVGKYTTQKGKKVSNAIPAHNLPLGALGVFILWFGWYGFNGAAAGSVSELAMIFATTTIAPAVATVVCMLLTWLKNGSPDVSMCLNASLAGLVAITAGCANVSGLGAAVIGAVAGILVVVVVEFLDLKCHVDDPVGAVAVHGACGAWGTLAVGLFDTTGGGLFYGGGVHQLGVQALGVASVALWMVITMTVVFKIIALLTGGTLRVTEDEEIEGLDATEHGLPSAYADFTFAFGVAGEFNHGDINKLPLVPYPSHPDSQKDGSPAKLTRVDIYCPAHRFERLKQSLESIGITGMTVTSAMGCGAQRGGNGMYRGVPVSMSLRPTVQVSVVVSKISPDLVVKTATDALQTGQLGDGKIFVTPVEAAIKVRTGETGHAALQDEAS